MPALATITSSRPSSATPLSTAAHSRFVVAGVDDRGDSAPAVRGDEVGSFGQFLGGRRIIWNAWRQGAGDVDEDGVGAVGAQPGGVRAALAAGCPGDEYDLPGHVWHTGTLHHSGSREYSLPVMRIIFLSGGSVCVRMTRRDRMGVLDGQTAFILGASAGIAQASARLLAADGATLYLLGRSSNRLDVGPRRHPRRSSGSRNRALQKGDPEDEATVAAAAQAAYDVKGRLDIVIGTVAIGGTGPLIEQDLETFTNFVMGNLRSNFLACATRRHS